MSDGTLELPDADWLQFVAEMEAAGPDGLGDVDSRIDYYLEKMRDGVAEMERNTKTAVVRLDTITDWLAGENAKIERRIRVLRESREMKLLDYLNERVRDGRLGTVDLPEPPPVDFCFCCEGTLEKHEPDCPQRKEVK